jgi:hypothetical protein
MPLPVPARKLTCPGWQSGVVAADGYRAGMMPEEDTVARYRLLVRADPAYRRHLAEALHSLGTARALDGDWARAQAALAAAVPILRELAAGDLGRCRRFLDRVRADLAAAENRSLPTDVCAMLSAGLHALAASAAGRKSPSGSASCCEPPGLAPT